MSFAPLPFMLVSWTQASAPGTGTWLQYNVYRQLPSDAALIRLAVITDITVTSYADYTCPSQVAAVYVLTQTVNVLGSLIESPGAVISGSLSFLNAFLHDVSTAAEYLQFRESSIAPVRQGDITFQHVAGSAAPVALVGEQDYSTITVTEVPHTWDDLLLRQTLDALFNRQIQQGSTFCLRLGYSAERYYVSFGNFMSTMGLGPTYADDVQQYVATAKFSEIASDEAV